MQPAHHEWFNLMECDFLCTLCFAGCFSVGFGFMKVFAFSRELAGRIYTGLGLFDRFWQNLALVNGLYVGLGSDSFRVSCLNASDICFDSAGIFVLRLIANAIRGWY